MPLAPRAPYSTVAEASFRMLKDSISSGWRRARLSVVDSKPSIKISGEAWYPNVVTPRTKNCALSAPGSPEGENAIRPGIRPANAEVKLEEGPCKSRALRSEEHTSELQ